MDYKELSERKQQMHETLNALVAEIHAAIDNGLIGVLSYGIEGHGTNKIQDWNSRQLNATWRISPEIKTTEQMMADPRANKSDIFG